MITARRWIVHGRVQGVGFRWFVSRRAGELGLEGFARNLDDGSVEIVARGSEAAVTELERHIRAGPRMSRVDNVETTDVPHDLILPKFFDTD